VVGVAVAVAVGWVLGVGSAAVGSAVVRSAATVCFAAAAVQTKIAQKTSSGSLGQVMLSFLSAGMIG
jgi:hypothetical protein